MIGFYVRSSIQNQTSTTGQSVNLSAYAIDPAVKFALASSPRSGSVAPTVTIPVHETIAGYKETGYSDLYYHQIWVIPRVTNLGNVVAYQETTIEVWNSQFTAQDLESITPVGDIAGLMLSGGIMSGTFAPLESSTYTLQASISGTPTIDVRYDFQFDDEKEPHSAFVVGRRVVAFTMRHNWSDAILEQIAYLTDVLTAQSGKEQRIGLRKHPRRRVEMSYLTLTPQMRAEFENLTFGWQGRVFAIPMWMDVTTLTVDAATGSTSFSFDTVNRDFDDDKLLFISNGTTYDILEIETVTPTGVTTKTSSLNAYNAGTKVVPARLGVMESKFDLDRHTNEIEAVRIAWQISPDEVSTNRREAYTPVLYRGVELYNVGNDYSNPISVSQTLAETIIDNDIGLVVKAPDEPNPRRMVPFKNLITRDELGLFLEWVYTREGMLKPFWFVDRTPAFRLALDELSTSTEITVDYNGYSNMVNVAASRRDIAIKSSAGWIYCRITAATDNGNGTETLELDSDLSVALTVAENPLISYCKMVRLNSDMVELNYETTNGIRTATSFIDLLTN